MNCLPQSFVPAKPRYQRLFEYDILRGCGFLFDCDERGHIDISRLTEQSRANLEACLRGEIEVLVDQEYESFLDEDGNVDYLPKPGTGRRVMRRLIDRGPQRMR